MCRGDSRRGRWRWPACRGCLRGQWCLHSSRSCPTLWCVHGPAPCSWCDAYQTPPLPSTPLTAYGSPSLPAYCCIGSVCVRACVCVRVCVCVCVCVRAVQGHVPSPTTPPSWVLFFCKMSYSLTFELCFKGTKPAKRFRGQTMPRAMLARASHETHLHEKQPQVLMGTKWGWGCIVPRPHRSSVRVTTR